MGNEVKARIDAKLVDYAAEGLAWLEANPEAPLVQYRACREAAYAAALRVYQNDAAEPKVWERAHDLLLGLDRA